MDSAYTSSSVPPSGYTGAPGESTCAASGCHDTNATINNSSFLALTSVPSGLFTSGYTPGQAYNITLNHNATSARYGFGLTVLDQLNNLLAGSITITAPTTTELLLNGGREYLGHENANTTNAWSFQWTAPAAGTDTVVFYVAGNAANGNNSDSGDFIHLNQFKLAEALAVSGCNEIFISEYVEGSGFNKAIELYNPTSAPINLNNYRIAQYNNGSANPGPFSNLSGIIPAYGTRVLVLDKRTGSPVTAAALQAKADTFMNPTNTAEALYFNGDDAVVIQRLNGTVVDIFGKPGQDPGTAWGSGANSTVNHTLVRKPTVTQGVTTIPTTFDPTVEWVAYAEDFFDSLGSHQSVCSPTFCNALVLTATPIDVTCFNAANGSVALSTAGGTGSYAYNTTATTALAPGNYTYIVTDNGSNCTDTVTVAITQPASGLSVNVTDRDLSCGVTNDAQAYADATGGTPPYTYSWSGGTTVPTGDSIINLTAGTYSVTVTDDNNCTTTGSVQVTAPQTAQQPSAIVGDASVCQSAVAEQYSVTSVNGETYTWAISGGGNLLPNGASAGITWTAVGTYTISVTASTAACGNATVQTLQVTVAAVPTTPVITGTDTLCAFGTQTYSATSTGAATYNWSVSSGGVITPSGASANIAWASAGTHTISVTATNNCGNSAVATYVVRIGNPSVSLGPDTTDCGQVQYTLSGFNSYLWSTGATTSQVTITQTGTVGVTVTNNLGCQASDAVNVTITPGATLTLPATASDCDTATVTAPGGFTTYNWSNGQNTTLGIFTQDGTYTLSVTDANGCNVSDDVVVTIFPEPATGIPGNASGCDTVVVTATAGYTNYVWSDGQTSQIGTFTNPGSYGLTVTDANGCQGVGTTTVGFNANPVANFTFNAVELDVDFDASGSAAGSYAWDFGNGTSSTDQNPSVTYAAEGTYTVTLVVTNSCGNDTLEQPVTVTTIGIADLMGVNGLEVYPNPAKGNLQVSWTATPGTVTIEIWNTIGTRVSTVQVDGNNVTETFNVANLVSGMYLLRIQIGSESKLVKFVRE